MSPNTDCIPLATPDGATAALVLADGTIFWGNGLGATGLTVGEVCFNTSITGYQEILTDPSYAGQIITFTFPHIGNVGINTTSPSAKLDVRSGHLYVGDEGCARSEHSPWSIEPVLSLKGEIPTRPSP